jgi:hypothetical protein
MNIPEGLGKGKRMGWGKQSGLAGGPSNSCYFIYLFVSTHVPHNGYGLSAVPTVYGAART